MKNKTFTVFADPGHAWLKVSLKDLKLVGVNLELITPFSFRRGDFVYLEEDCDVAVFFEKYKERFGYYPKNETKHTNKSSKIRQYNSFNFSPYENV